MKIKVIAIPHLEPMMNVGNSEKITLTDGKSTRFNDSNQFWFYALGSYLMDQYSSELDFEIWQPDTQIAETITKKYRNGLVYKLIPGSYKNKYTLTGIKKRLFSQKILDAIETEIINQQKLVLFFRGTREFILERIVSRYYKKVPFVAMFSVQINNLLIIEQFYKNPLIEGYYYLFGLLPYKRFLRKVENFVPSTQDDIRSNPFFKKLNVFYRENLSSWGIDTDFWKRRNNSAEFKEKYNIKKDDRVLLISSRIVEEKQVKEMISALGNFSDYHFKLFVTGNISNNLYVNETVELAKNLLKEKVVFTGYVSDEELRDLYTITDLMLSYSISEGGPFSIFQAYLMEIPVIQSSVGIASEMARKFNVSSLADPFNNQELIAVLQQYFAGNIPKTLDRRIAVNYFNWTKVTSYYLEVFRQTAM